MTMSRKCNIESTEDVDRGRPIYQNEICPSQGKHYVQDYEAKGNAIQNAVPVIPKGLSR